MMQGGKAIFCAVAFCAVLRLQPVVCCPGKPELTPIADGQTYRGHSGSFTGNNIHVIGHDNTITGTSVTAEGNNLRIVGDRATVVGNSIDLTGSDANIKGNRVAARGGQNYLIKGNDVEVHGNFAIVTGNSVKVVGNGAIVDGDSVVIVGDEALATGNSVTVTGRNAKVAGWLPTVYGKNAYICSDVGEGVTVTGSDIDIVVGYRYASGKVEWDANRVKAQGRDATVTSERGRCKGNYIDNGRVDYETTIKGSNLVVKVNGRVVNGKYNEGRNKITIN